MGALIFVLLLEFFSVFNQDIPVNQYLQLTNVVGNSCKIQTNISLHDLDRKNRVLHTHAWNAPNQYNNGYAKYIYIHALMTDKCIN